SVLGRPDQGDDPGARSRGAQGDDERPSRQWRNRRLGTRIADRIRRAPFDTRLGFIHTGLLIMAALPTDKLDALERRFDSIEYSMSASPDPEKYVELSKEYSELSP